MGWGGMGGDAVGWGGGWLTELVRGVLALGRWWRSGGGWQAGYLFWMLLVEARVPARQAAVLCLERQKRCVIGVCVLDRRVWCGARGVCMCDASVREAACSTCGQAVHSAVPVLRVPAVECHSSQSDF